MDPPQKKQPAAVLKATDLAFAKCECCGLTEECTEEYIKRVRDRYSGRWICGLCAEAVKDEVIRSAERIGNEEALDQHMSFCRKFQNLTPPKNPTEELISAVKQLLFKSLDSPRSSPRKKTGFDNFSGLDSPRSSPLKRLGLARSDNCFSTLESSPVRRPGSARAGICFPGLDS